MSIREIRPGVWEIAVYIGMDGADRKISYATVYGGRKDAKEKEVQLKTKKDKEVVIKAGQLTVSAFLVSWVENYVKPLRAEKTVKNYELHIKRLNPYIGHIVLRKLKPEDIQQAYSKLAKTTSASTIRGAHRVLHAALHRAYKNGLLPTNIVDAVEQPRPTRFRPRVLTPDEAIKLLAAAKGSQHYELVAIALLTGMRLGELASLKWENIDFEAATLEVQQSKTEAGYRTVYLDISAVSVLMDLYAKKRPSKDSYVFLGKTGKPLCVDSISKDYLSGITKKAGLPRMRFHDLRHTHATWLAAANISARTVADRLGHVDPSFTLRTYAHASIEAQKQAAAIAGSMLRLPGNSQDGQ